MFADKCLGPNHLHATIIHIHFSFLFEKCTNTRDFAIERWIPQKRMLTQLRPMDKCCGLKRILTISRPNRFKNSTRIQHLFGVYHGNASK